MIELTTLNQAIKGLPDATTVEEGKTFKRDYKESTNGEDLKDARQGEVTFIATTVNYRGVEQRRWLCFTGAIILDRL